MNLESNFDTRQLSFFSFNKWPKQVKNIHISEKSEFLEAASFLIGVSRASLQKFGKSIASESEKLQDRFNNYFFSFRGFVLLQGGSELGLCKGDSSDFVNVFRQESFFHWAFGVLEPNVLGGIDLQSGESFLFIPKLPTDYAVWMGKLRTRDEFAER